jgi:hypothetical protein
MSKQPKKIKSIYQQTNNNLQKPLKHKPISSNSIEPPLSQVKTIHQHVCKIWY